MNRKSLYDMTTKELIEHTLSSLERRQSSISCKPAEYKEIQDEIDELKKIAHMNQPNHRIERIDLRNHF